MKRIKMEVKSFEDPLMQQYDSLATKLIHDYVNFDTVIQQRILNQISQMLLNDEELLLYSIKMEAKVYYTEALQFFQERNYSQLTNIFDNISPMTTIKLNLKIAKQITALSEESATLSKTLIPYLQGCLNFHFIQDKYKPISCRFTESLKQYYIDTQNIIDKGFIRFALEFSPEALQNIINNNENQKSLNEALSLIGFCDMSSQIISLHPQKFLWTELLNILEKLEAKDKISVIKLLSKLIIIQDCGSKIPLLMNSLASREIFINILLEKEQINLTLMELITILDMLKGLQKETILLCFSKETHEWKKTANASLGQEFFIEGQMNEQQIHQFYNDQIKEINTQKKVSLEEMINCSKIIENSCSSYQHNLYQCSVAALICSQSNTKRIIEMPTASGKTWVQCLLAMFYILQGHTVKIIEPNEQLRNQTSELLGEIHSDLSVCTIKFFYEYPCKESIIIINEHDSVLLKSPFMATMQGITGLWSLQNRVTIFFSATSNKGIEKIIKNFVGVPITMNFQSEFEHINKSSALQGAQIKTSNTKEEALEKLENDILQFYEEKPIIIYSDTKDIKRLLNFFKKNQITRFIQGFNEEVQIVIRQWNNGILILEPDNYCGINTRFNKDSIVLISCCVETEQQYIQMQGRSSRSRGLCHSIYYPITQCSPQIVIQKLKAHNNNYLQELYYLIKVVWTKRQTQSLLQAIENAQNDNDQINSLKDLQEIMGKPSYLKLVKGLEF